MKRLSQAILLILFLPKCFTAAAQQQTAIYSGVPWFDEKGNTVSAHGACIIKDKNRFYLFGEKHSDTSNAFAGFNCYSSTDLYNWKFESIALPVQQSGKLGPGRVGERVKVMRCPATGEYVMYMHVDTLGYKDQCIGYATAKNITGPYSFKGPLLFNGSPVKKWDMGTFQDKDGLGYLLVHGGDIYKLNDDYKSIGEQVLKNMASECESPAVFRKGERYYWLASHRTSWERNDNFYYSAASLKGPWTYHGIFAPAGTLTFNSQTTFVVPIEGAKDTTYMFMGDRWAFPKQASAATYVWQPLQVNDTLLSLNKYEGAWSINTTTGIAQPASLTSINDPAIIYKGNWTFLPESTSDAKGDEFTISFSGRQIGFYSMSKPGGGYAQVVIKNNKGKIVCSSIVDMYCKYPVSSLKFISPVFAKGKYSLTVTVMGERGNWTDKRKLDYGSKGNFITVEKIVLNQ